MKKTITIVVGYSSFWVMVGSPERITDKEFKQIKKSEAFTDVNFPVGLYHVEACFPEDSEEGCELSNFRILKEL